MNPMSGSLMAVKQVELPTGNSHNEERKKSMLDALEREIELLKVLQHESESSPSPFPFPSASLTQVRADIVQYLDSSSDATHLNIFLEYVPGGSVAALLSNYGAFEEALVSKFVRQILTGLEYLHEREIIHRDIKGANILVDNNGGIKISDFGISKKVEDSAFSSACASNRRLTRPVCRPSLGLQGSSPFAPRLSLLDGARGRQADGVHEQGRHLELGLPCRRDAHRRAPLGQLDPDAGNLQGAFSRSSRPLLKLTRFANQIGSSACPTIPDDLSTDAEDFLEQTFLIDYKERPPARELLQHAFIKEVDARTAEQQTPTRATFSQQNSPVKAEVAS